jgi:hypothetical protein
MDDEHAEKPVQSGEPRPASPPQGPRPAPRTQKDAAPDPSEEYSDPICVCEAEPYWQEIAERLERDE